jgi:hypothetical protein
MRPPRNAVTEDVAGDPIRIRGRLLTPIVRASTQTRRRAVIGTEQESASVYRSVHDRPLAVIETTGRGVRRVAIRDVTRLQFTLMKWTAALLLGAAMLLVGSRPTDERSAPDD